MEKPGMGVIRRITVVILGFIVVFFLIWFIALQGSGGDNDAAPLASPVAERTG